MAAPSPQLSPEFTEFLLEARQHGYGTEEAAAQPLLASGAHQVTYEQDPYSYTDLWVGGNPYAGFEHVSAKIDGQYTPIWAMTYLETKLDGMQGDELTAVLARVLRQPDPALPLRVPKHWEQDGVRYGWEVVDKTSSLAGFDIKEYVAQGGRRVYVARIMGGLVNRDNVETVQDKFWLTAASA